jgi:virginiamycin A acetyltransferase
LEDKVVIGKFCSIADDVKMLPSGNHRMAKRVSTYPFKAKILEQGLEDDIASKGPIIIGNDV